MSYLVLILLFAGAVLFGLAWNMSRSKQDDEQVIHQREDLIWNAHLRWQENQKKQIQVGSIEAICPNCADELQPMHQDQFYFLFCETCKFISTEYAEHGKHRNPDKLLYDSLQKILS